MEAKACIKLKTNSTRKLEKGKSMNGLEKHNLKEKQASKDEHEIRKRTEE
jgi:hypothetical protein